MNGFEPFAPPRPLPLKKAVKTVLDDLCEQAAAHECDLRSLLDRHPAYGEFLASVFALSPFLRDCAIRSPKLIAELPDTGFDNVCETILVETGQAALATSDQAQLMAKLRLKRSQMALVCGLADLGKWWDGITVTGKLSQFADLALGAAMGFVLARANDAGRINLPDASDPQTGCGWVALAMGKMGAGELNYSSDIDLIIFHDDQVAAVAGIDDPTSFFARLVKQVVKILSERTGDGYVFRVDLRLRPDPGSTPPSLPMEAALNYYEGQGQNWERSALIKARPAAGDMDAGAWFLSEIAPFIWRRYLDYAAIGDIHSIKRQIHAHKGFADIAVRGHNVKLGRGGIREVEFFVQTQQLIAGGRNTELRGRGTIAMLGELAKNDWISDQAVDELTKAYWFLRDTEHRLQMIADEQTHVLPEGKEGMRVVATMMGFDGEKAFAKELTAHMRRVENHYGHLFETSAKLSGVGGNLVFTGGDDDPGTLETLAQMGFAKPSGAIRIIRNWHYGRFAAVRSSAAREHLTEITPALLEAIAATGQADITLSIFDAFLSGLPAGIQLFSLLRSNPGLTRLLVLVMGSAPRLAEIIARKPHVFDAVIDPAFLDDLPARPLLESQLVESLDQANGYEGALDRARLFCAEQKFLIGTRLLMERISPAQAGYAFTVLAEVITDAIVRLVSAEFAQAHGQVPGSRICVLGMGRVGNRELTFGSDLDLMFLYDHPPEVAASDGRRALDPVSYFIRLSQRIISAMSSPMAEGLLYELDFRLRPSGNAGPLATHFDGFCKYQREEAWNWEHMALTRARVIAGDPGLAGLVQGQIAEILTRERDHKKLAKDIATMRERIDKEKDSANAWKLKTVKGGIIDIEFIAQWLLLSVPRDVGGMDPPTTAAAIAAAPAERLGAGDRECLAQALDLYSTITQIARVAVADGTFLDEAPAGLIEIICQRCDMSTSVMLKAHLVDTQKRVRRIFNKLFRR